MEIQIGNQIIKIKDFHSIDPQLDEAYQDFFVHFFSNPDYTKLINEYLPAINPAVIDYFRRTNNKETIQKEIINNFTCVWLELRKIYPLLAAAGFWETVLKLVQ